MNINKYIPVDVNIYHTDFQFETFLNIDFDSFISQNFLLNSKQLYLVQKNKYITNTMNRTNQFINLQQSYLKYVTKNTTYYTSQTHQQQIKQELKSLFNLQKKELELFLHYISYITKHSQLLNE